MPNASWRGGSEKGKECDGRGEVNLVESRGEQRMDLLNWILSTSVFSILFDAIRQYRKPKMLFYMFSLPPSLSFSQSNCMYVCLSICLSFVPGKQTREVWGKGGRGGVGVKKSEKQKSNYTAQWFFGFWCLVAFCSLHGFDVACYSSSNNKRSNNNNNNNNESGSNSSYSSYSYS